MALPGFYNQADQDIYAGGDHFIPQEDYRLNYTPSTTLASTVGNSGGITSTNAFTNSGGGGGFGGGNTNQLIGDFYDVTANRQKSLENPNWLGKALNNFLPQQRSVKDMIAPPTGNYSRSLADTTNFGLDILPGAGQYGDMPGVIEEDERMLGGLPLGIGSMINKFMPDKYYDMDAANQAYIQSQMGYSGPTVFGENTMGNKDPFGRNVRSAFGDYGAAQEKSIGRFDKNIVDKYAAKGLTLNKDAAGNYYFSGDDEEYAKEINRLNKLNLQRYSFDKRGLRKRDLIKQNVATQKKMRDAWEAETGREMDAADRAFADTGDYDEYAGAGGTPSYSIPAGAYSYEGSDEQDEAANYAPSGNNEPHGTDTSGDFAGKGSGNPFGRAQGGRIGYFDGGLARLL